MAWTVVTSSPQVICTEAALNDSSKELTTADLPEFYQEIEIVGLRIVYASSNDAGNRTIAVQLINEADSAIISEVEILPVQIANTTIQYELVFGAIGGGAATGTAGAANYYLVSSPRMFLSKGVKLKVFDSAAIAATADDMTVYVRGLVV